MDTTIDLRLDEQTQKLIEKIIDEKLNNKFLAFQQEFANLEKKLRLLCTNAMSIMKFFVRFMQLT